ncbi:MAG: type VII toxin-antitoxin system HepT family RNase toxin [Nitrospirota bacterium]
MERIRQKIGRTREYLSIIRSIKDDCLACFQSDYLYRGALLHYLYLLTDTCISLGEIVIKYRKLRPPQSYQDVFDIRGEHKILEPEFAFSFARIAGFRNFLAHDYEKIDIENICKGILSKLDDVDIFLEQIKDSIGLT